MTQSYTRQTPAATKEWLAGKTLAFPQEWTLDDVADECHRRYLAGRWANEMEAGRAVVAWAGHKLAICKSFAAEHWGWIAALDEYDQTNGYSRLLEIVRPAIAATPTWRKTEGEREQEMQGIDKAAAYLLKLLESSMVLDVSLRGVAGWYPEMQPLVDHSHSLQQHEMKRGKEAARKVREAGAGLATIVLESIPLDGYREPRLSDFLWTLRAAIRGTLREARPTGQGETVEDVLGKLKPDDAARLSKQFGLTIQRNVSPSDALRSGGDFGNYPARKDALRRAVILAFPRAIFCHRFTDPPKATPASMIESACNAWFGNAPTQKEINAAIKPDRDALQPAMLARIHANKKSAERRARWQALGLSQEEIRHRSLMDFLDADVDDLSDIEKKALSAMRKARDSKASKVAKRQKAGNLPPNN